MKCVEKFSREGVKFQQPQLESFMTVAAISPRPYLVSMTAFRLMPDQQTRCLVTKELCLGMGTCVVKERVSMTVFQYIPKMLMLLRYIFLGGLGYK